MGVDLLRTELFDDNGLFTLITVPPDVVGLDEGVRKLGPDMG